MTFLLCYIPYFVAGALTSAIAYLFYKSKNGMERIMMIYFYALLSVFFVVNGLMFAYDTPRHSFLDLIITVPLVLLLLAKVKFFYNKYWR